MNTTPPPWSAPPLGVPLRRQSSPILLTLVAALSVSALILAIVALIRPASSTSVYTAGQRTAAKTHLCERYKLAADAEHIETNGSDAALARISLVNGANMLQSAAADPALDPAYSAAADSLAESYQTMAAASSMGSDDPHYKAALQSVISQESALKTLCGQ
ncbi:hypothetical protein ABW16_16710 [Mycolicibacter heraklionensis]|uniref:Uncharacterized protein n=1 Tax=Mycolicibacter heraklionensis TaxID=512402 RepID=A0ABR5FCC8_9MYCO|nr:hypothetical protein [Mycolicibacter heraklionensis]KLO27242.1 hypothetical protein ABW16_16710 [Mycolicibacter heraklionensis]